MSIRYGNRNAAPTDGGKYTGPKPISVLPAQWTAARNHHRHVGLDFHWGWEAVSSASRLAFHCLTSRWPFHYTLMGEKVNRQPGSIRKQLIAAIHLF